MYKNSGINKVFLLGQVLTTPKMHQIDEQGEWLNFQLVTHEIISKKEHPLHLEYHQIILPPGTELSMEVIALKRGDLVHLTGKIQTHQYIEQDIRRYKTQILAQQIIVLNRLEAVVPKVFEYERTSLISSINTGQDK